MDVSVSNQNKKVMQKCNGRFNIVGVAGLPGDAKRMCADGSHRRRDVPNAIRQSCRWRASVPPRTKHRTTYRVIETSFGR